MAKQTMGAMAIRVENLGKRYRIGMAEAPPRKGWPAIKSLATSPLEYLRRMARPPTEEETLWALRNVSFEVAPIEKFMDTPVKRYSSGLYVEIVEQMRGNSQ